MLWNDPKSSLDANHNQSTNVLTPNLAIKTAANNHYDHQQTYEEIKQFAEGCLNNQFTCQQLLLFPKHAEEERPKCR